MVAQQFLTEIGKKNDVSEAVFLIDGDQSLQAASRRAGYDFRYENMEIGIPSNVSSEK